MADSPAVRQGTDVRTAYCMACDEQVHETPSGTCPAGHPLAGSEDTGPEPWVGFAASAAGAAATGRPAERAADSSPPPRYRSVDVAGLQEAPVSHGVNGNGSGQHAPEVTSPAWPAPEPRREPSVGDASDELASMLADAFDQVEPPTEDAPGPDAVIDDAPSVPDVPAPADVPDPPATPTGASDAPPARDWDDLATLAAELELEDRGETPKPEPRDVPAAEVADEPAAPVNETPTAPPPPPAGPPLSQEPPPADLPPADLTPADPPATDIAPPPALDPVAPLDADGDPLWDPVDPPAVPSAPEAPEAEPAPPTLTVDLGNFTARGTPVRGGSDTGRPSRKKKSRRKR